MPNDAVLRDAARAPTMVTDALVDWPVAPTLLAAAIFVLGLALVPAYKRWQRRRRAWLTDPQQLTDAQPASSGIHALVVVAAVAIGISGVAMAIRSDIPPAVAVAIAAIAALVVTHRAQSLVAGHVAFLLLGESIVLAGLAWLPSFDLRALLGCAVAGIYFVWLAHFWRQQLLDGQAWTTAGQLIPAAQHLGMLSGFATLACAAHALMAYAYFRPQWLFGSLMAMLAVGLLAWRLAGMARATHCWRLTAAAAAAGLALLAPLLRVLASVADIGIRMSNG